MKTKLALFLSLFVGALLTMNISGCAKKGNGNGLHLAHSPIPKSAAQARPVHKAMIRSCKNLNSFSYEVKGLRRDLSDRNPFDVSLSANKIEIPSILIPIPSYTSLEKIDVFPPPRKTTLGEVFVQLALAPLLTKGTNVRLDVTIADYDFFITAAFSTEPELDIEGRTLSRTADGSVQWANSRSDFDCRLNDNNLELCKTAMEYKLSDLGQALTQSLQPAEKAQLLCTQDLLQSQHDTMKSRVGTRPFKLN